jgi:CBS-domain-containing membrane protein
MSVLAPPELRELTAADVMSAPVITVTAQTSPWAAWSAMLRQGVRHLVVTRNNRCVGLLDDRDVFAQWPMGPLALRRATVGAMMRPRTSCVLPAAGLREVAHVMTADRVDAVPVVDDDGMVLGLVTAGDLVAAVAKYGVREEELTHAQPDQ